MTRQLPLEAVRDLIGIARAMYLAAKRDGASARAAELAEIGKRLKHALDLGMTDPRSLGHRAAWSHAEEATSRLMRLISTTTALAPVAQAAVLRIRRHRSAPGPSERDEKRAATRARS